MLARRTSPGNSCTKGEYAPAAVRINSSRARVRPTKKSLRSSSTSQGSSSRSSGSAPSLTPARNTTGNSKPFAPCSVISRTAPEA